jgi:hypothetical protein
MDTKSKPKLKLAGIGGENRHIMQDIHWWNKMRFRINALNIANFGTGIVLTLGVPLVYGKQLETLVGKFKANTEWELKPYKQKRSLSANNYFWVLADKIAEAIKSDKELVYWQLIQRVGVFETFQFKDQKAMDRFKSAWQSKGLGWLTRTVDEDKFVLQAYYGSSVYDTAEMSRLIDEAVSEAKRLGIETKPQWEIDSMLKEWR